MTSANGGQIDRNLMDAHFIMNHVLEHPGMPRDIHQNDVGLFYLLSKCNFSGCTDDSQTLFFIITILKVTENNISPIYREHMYGWIKNNIYHKINFI